MNLGGLIQLNQGKPSPLPYVVNAAFLASLYADYQNATGSLEVECGPNFYSLSVLKRFATSQVRDA